MGIGFGTAAIGRPSYINIRNKPAIKDFNLEAFKVEGIRMLEEAYKAGIRYFDTAPGYGIAESIIRDWQQQNPYDDIEVATKWGYKYTANFNPNAEVHEIKDHSLNLLKEQWRVSEKLPHVKTLQIHSATFESGVLDNKEVLNRLFEIKNTSKVLIGLTTSGPNQSEIIKYALGVHVHGYQLFDTFQVTYNMLDQSLFELKSDLTGKRIIIKEALANGRLFRNENYPTYFRLYDKLESIATDRNVGVDAIALRFCIDTINPFMVLSGASEVNQLKENLKANTVKLDTSELEDLQSFGVEPHDYWSERKLLDWN